MIDEDEFYYEGLKDKESDFANKKVIEANQFISEMKEAVSRHRL